MLLVATGLLLVQVNSTELEKNFTCAGKKVCAEMQTCSEARFYLET